MLLLAILAHASISQPHCLAESLRFIAAGRGLGDRIALKNPKFAKQLVEAAASMPTAISEGRGRGTDADFAHFLSIAIGSANEVENHLQRALHRKWISASEHRSFTDDVIEVRKMLVGLRKTLLNKRQG